MTQKPRGLSRPAAILASSRFGASPIETVTPTSLLDLAGEPRQHQRRRPAVQRRGAGQVEHRLVDRQRLHERRQPPHQRPDLPRHRDVFGEIRADHHRVRAGFQRLEHRHGAAHAVDPRDIAGRRHHPAHAAADDHRPRRQLRPVALLHAGVEGVAIDMRDGEREQLGVPHDPPPAAARAGRRVAGIGIAVAAERGHYPMSAAATSRRHRARPRNRRAGCAPPASSRRRRTRSAAALSAARHRGAPCSTARRRARSRRGRGC